MNYAFRDKYLFEANFRYDGSSKFAKDNRWGLFPSFSGGWKISEEPFMQNVSFLDNLKLRASWGQLGNQENPAVGLYPYIQTISLGQDYPFGNSIQPGVAQTALANEDISWETTTTTDIGVHADFGPVEVEFDYFNKLTEDILRPAQISLVVGALTAPSVNQASVKNTGWELMLKYANTLGDLSYSANFNVTQVHNKIVSIPEPVTGNFSILQEGDAINSRYLLRSDGIYQSQNEVDNSATWNDKVQPGDIKYVDTNGDGKITYDDRVVVGSIIPEWTFGFALTANYKGFDLSAFFQGVKNVESMPRMELVWPFFNGAGVDKKWKDAWTSSNKTDELPRLTTNTYTANFVNSDFWLQDASYLRLKNLQLGYTFSNRYAKFAMLEGVRLYVNVQNLFTLTKFEGLDPEKAIEQSRSDTHPNVRIVSIGTNLQF